MQGEEEPKEVRTVLKELLGVKKQRRKGGPVVKKGEWQVVKIL